MGILLLPDLPFPCTLALGLPFAGGGVVDAVVVDATLTGAVVTDAGDAGGASVAVASRSASKTCGNT